MRFGAAVSVALCLVVGFGCAHPARRPRGLEEVSEPGEVTHRVRAGETLTSIAARYGTTAALLAELNQLDDPNALRIDQLLVLPAGTVGGQRRREPGPAPDLGGRAPDPILACEAHSGAPSGWAVSEAGLSWPTDGVILTRFGQLDGRKHEGLAIGAPLGTPVWASAPGEVILAGSESGYGQLVVVRHGSSRVGLYGGLERACVQEGSRVGRGALIGLVGDSSGVASPRLYFELREGEAAVDPRPRLP